MISPSLLEHILNHAGSEQCWAPMLVEPEASLPPGESRVLGIDPIEVVNFGAHIKSHWRRAAQGAFFFKPDALLLLARLGTCRVTLLGSEQPGGVFLPCKSRDMQSDLSNGSLLER